jgi:tRNA pseudouridine38-40 synthase
METYKSIIAYDGTAFQGFQRQAGDRRTVQGVFEQALRKLGWQERSITAAGRTDAGVHARGQVVAFELAWRHAPQQLTQALNANLPPDIAVWWTAEAAPKFHPRFDAVRRRYRYTLITAPVRHPLRERYAWRIWPEPDVTAMEIFAGELMGRHDFAAFGRASIPGGETVRNVFRAEWISGEGSLCFKIEANAFLYHMVRKLVAAMVKVGSRSIGPQDVLECLNNPQARWEGAIAPACGLCLEEVTYPEWSSAKIEQGIVVLR